MDIITIFESLLRRWWLLLLCAGAGLACAYALATNAPRRYQSTVSLQLNPAARTAFLPYQSDAGVSASNPVVALAASYQEVLRSRSFAEVVIRDLNLQISPGTIAGSITTQLIPNTNILYLSVIWDNPADAQQLTQRVAEIFIAENQRRQQSQPGTQARLADMEQSARDIQSRRAPLEQQRDRLDEAVARGDLSRLNDLTALDTRLTALDASYANLLVEISRVRGGFDTAVILDPAGAARALDALPLQQGLLFGLLGGVVFAVAAVLILERAANVVRSPFDVKSVAGVPVLGSLGHLRQTKGNTAGRSRALVALDRRSRAAEAFRSLRTALLLGPTAQQPRMLLVGSAAAREGKTLIAANLAIVLAQAGRRVLLIDANMRDPAIHLLFGVANTSGFCEALAAADAHGDSGRWPQPAASGIPNLWLLPVGQPLPDPGESLAPDTVRLTLERLSEGWDFIVVDSAETGRYADTLTLAHVVSACIVVARSGRTSRPALRGAVVALDAVAQQVIGVVLNDEQSRPLSRFARHNHDPYWPTMTGSDSQSQTLTGLPPNGRASAPTPTIEPWRT